MPPRSESRHRRTPLVTLSTPGSGQFVSRLRAPLIGAMLTAAAASPGHAQAQGDAAIGVGCDQATAAAAKACALEAEADYFDALGRCANTGPGGNLGACSSAAESARTEAQVECGAQEQARHRVCAALGQAPYDPQIKPSNFVRRITNPFLPLEPGTVFTYRGKDVVDTVEVLDETVVIQGVRCVVVRDTNVVEGKLEEDTFDYYAQDRAGNVWYFGEATTEYAGGAAVSNEGAWVAGVDDAKPGIIMPAKPQVGVTSRTEYALGEAEDLARIENLGVRVRLPGGRFGKALQTFEFSPLEPESRGEHKYYVRGVGLVLEVDLNTGERMRLVKVEQR